MIKFLLNNQSIHTDQPQGMLLLDFIRYHQHLKGTKIGCREGDCGACTVLIGEMTDGRLRYRSATSCLTPLGNIHHKHIVTIEGLNGEGLSPLQEAICAEGGTQCGFCTPGFIVSMAAYCLTAERPGLERAVASVDGNICRCTGYKSIERALARVVLQLQQRGEGVERMGWLMERGILPEWFGDIAQRLEEMRGTDGRGGSNGVMKARPANGEMNGEALPLGGGTDLYVQQHERMPGTEIRFLFNDQALKGIRQLEDICEIGAAATVTDLLESSVIRKAFPHFGRYAALISSTPIRNIATIAGNFVNASPIGDLSIIFLALDARLLLTDGFEQRELALREFFLGYKQLNKHAGEWISAIRFRLPSAGDYFHFEKVSKRTHLDIASVNTAIRLRVKDGLVEEGHISAGGVGPVPAYLAKASAAMRGRKPEEGLVLEVVETAAAEIRPISDARGTAAYKTLLLGQLIKAHFLTLFPNLRAEALI